MINTGEKEVLLFDILVEGYSYQFMGYKRHQDKYKFTLETRVNACEKQNVKLFLNFIY